MRLLDTNKTTPGSILWARYSFSPNRFKYCGPDKNLELFEYTSRQKTDRGLTQILSHFEAAFPYIEFIARENKIKDPFDFRAVEAYWLGNDLLNHIHLNKFYHHLKDRYLKRFKTKTSFDEIAGKIPLGARPYHAFHVLEIFREVGSMRSINHGPVLKTINNCLIGWGKVIKIADEFLEVEYRPLELLNHRLVFGPAQTKKIEYKFRHKSFFDTPQIGNRVSIHWNWACDILTPRQLQNLQKWTLWHLKIANSFNVPSR